MPEIPENYNDVEKSGFSHQDIERFLYSYDGSLRKRMFEKAQKSRDEEAISHRGFKVGCAVCTVEKRKDGSEVLKIRSAGNFTPADKPKPNEAKWCAERNAINSALKEGGTFIPAIVTVSSETDAGNGEKPHKVLHSCVGCRALIRHLLEEGYLDPESKICNINDKDPENLVVEEMTVIQLLDMYQKDLENEQTGI